jgi:hypothetical protein
MHTLQHKADLSIPLSPLLPPIAPPLEDALSSSLRQLFSPISIKAHEREFLSEAERWLPGPAWAGFLVRWSRALEALGTPSTFVSGLAIQPVLVQVGDKQYEGTAISAPGNAQRRELMAKQLPYYPNQGRSNYPEDFDTLGCFLCQNIAQAMDADVSGTPSNALADLGTHVLLPNRYPAVPGHSLLLRKSHDSPRSTRGAILSPEELHTWMIVADELECAATHNHVHDAMSIPSHEHCHLMPRRFPLLAPIEQLRRDYGAYTPHLRAIVLSGTPFEHLVLYGPSRAELAAAAAPVLEAFERAGIVTTFVYSDRKLLISHRKGDAGANPRLSLGAGITFLGFGGAPAGLTPSVEEIALKMPLRPGALGSILVSMSDGAVKMPETYHALNYKKLIPLGEGHNLRSRLTSSEWRLWEAALPYQDKRLDKGHAEIVSLFSLLLSDAEHLDLRERRVALVSSMLHDIGWSQIERVDEKFCSIQHRLRSDDQSVRAQAKSDDRAIRVLHQDLGAELARTLLANSEWDDIRDEVCVIIRDHDTRDAEPPGRACEVMWDSDMLWRTTLPHAHMVHGQSRLEATKILEAMERWAQPVHYRTAFARQVALEELRHARASYSNAS